MSTTFTVPNKNGSYDGDYVLKQYTTLTIAGGNTVTTDQPCRGMFFYVQGNCVIDGTLTMTRKGAFANPQTAGGSDSAAVQTTGLRLGLLKSSNSA